MAEIIGFSRPPFSSIFLMAHLLFGTSAILPWEAMFLHFHINFAALSDAFAHQYFFQSSAILHCAQHHQPSCLIGTDTGIKCALDCSLEMLLLLVGALSPVNHRGLHQGCAAMRLGGEKTDMRLNDFSKSKCEPPSPQKKKIIIINKIKKIKKDQNGGQMWKYIWTPNKI